MEGLSAWTDLTIESLFELYPYSRGFFDINGLSVDDLSDTVNGYVSSLPYVFLEDIGVDREGLLKRFSAYMSRMGDAGKGREFSIHDITILGGRDKRGKEEDIELQISMGEIVCIVGPTGSGKSQLLADIEWMAQRDTPTSRQILIDGAVPPKNWRFSIEHKLVAQLSQNMNFVMDICVGDFIRLHAQSRMVDDTEDRVQKIVSHANELSGEEFDLSTPLTSLSGGQSRALMVADTAFLSRSPIVLIDELENAGIDRRKAVELLIGQNMIVLIATHDPLLALMGARRIVIKHGGIQKVIETTPTEKRCLMQLAAADRALSEYRELLREGNLLNGIEQQGPCYQP